MSISTPASPAGWGAGASCSCASAWATPHYGLAAILKAANDGVFNFIDEVREYAEKARIMKKMFTDNGFSIVYDKDEDQPIADGFYFTYAYPGFRGTDLINEMIYYGISAISLDITGSERHEGVRACVSLVHRDQFPDLEKRLRLFHADHPCCHGAGQLI